MIGRNKYQHINVTMGSLPKLMGRCWAKHLMRYDGTHSPYPPGIPLEINQLHMEKKNMCKALVLPEVFLKIVAK